MRKNIKGIAAGSLGLLALQLPGMTVFKAEPAAEAPKTAPVVAAPVQETDDLELVAVIAAAIAASENVPVDSFRVRTIKRR